MTDIAIDVRNVSKSFKLYHNAILGPVFSSIRYWDQARYYNEFVALRNVSFQVKRGEVVGIIGANGAGKTTLLKAIANLLSVDGGEIAVNGRLAILLALGVGVNPDLPGRDNILLNGLLLGMGKDEIDAKIDEIVEFAEIGNFIDQPMRTYSSGMQARLLFSIAMSVQSEVMIVDEALATGDSYFVGKSTQRIRQLCASGSTILFVSHNLEQIKQLCDRAILLEGGEVLMDAEPREVISAYHSRVFANEGKSAENRRASEMEMLGGTGEVHVKSMRLLDDAGKTKSAFCTGDDITVELDYVSETEDVGEVTVFLGIDIHDKSQYVGEVYSGEHFSNACDGLTKTPLVLSKTGKIVISLRPNLLLNNTYSFWLIIQRHNFDRICEYRGLSPFFVARKDSPLNRDALFMVPADFRVINGE